MNTRSIRRRTGFLVGLALTAATSGACGRTTGGPAGPGGAPADGDHAVVVVSATSNEFRPSFTPRALRELTTLAQSRNVSDGKQGKGSAVLMSTVDGQRAATVMLTPRRADGRVEHGHQRDKLIQENLDKASEQLSAMKATRSGLDLLEGIGTAVRGNGPGLLIVISSGLGTDGGFDLRQLGWAADPQGMAKTLSDRGLLPDLAGWRVLFTGLGSTAGEQPPLPLPQYTTLSHYWLALCQAMNATGCDIDDTRIAPVGPAATIRTPIVPVPGITSVTGPDNEVTMVLSNDVLGFTGDSAALSAAAVDLLRQVAARINVRTAGNPRAVVTINGYAADPPRSTDQGRRQLSQQRADATMRELVGDGVTARIEAHGLGTPPGTTAMIGGVFNEGVASGMRRVEITY